MNNTTLIRGGTLITPQGQRAGDLRLVGEKIAGIGSGLAAEGTDRVVDATGCVVLPGLVDPHTHIVLDTGIYKTPDDWAVGTRTAACGGVTTVIDFATQFPGQDVRGALAARQAEIGGLAQIDYGLHMMLTALPESDAELDRWMIDLLADGINAVKVYTTYRPNYYQADDALLRVFGAAAAHDVVVMIHCENDALVSAAREALVRAGKTGLAYHGQARPALAEIEAANRTLFLASQQGAGSEQQGRGAGEHRCMSSTAPFPARWNRLRWPQVRRPARHRRDDGAIPDTRRDRLHRSAPRVGDHAAAAARAAGEGKAVGAGGIRRGFDHRHRPL